MALCRNGGLLAYPVNCSIEALITAHGRGGLLHHSYHLLYVECPHVTWDSFSHPASNLEVAAIVFWHLHAESNQQRLEARAKAPPSKLTNFQNSASEPRDHLVGVLFNRDPKLVEATITVTIPGSLDSSKKVLFMSFPRIRPQRYTLGSRVYNPCICVHIYTHMCTYIYMYVFICIHTPCLNVRYFFEPVGSPKNEGTSKKT